MNVKSIIGTGLALLLSVGLFAQTQPPTDPAKPHRSPEQRAAHRQAMKARLNAMTPAERKAFRQKHREQRQARLNAMTPEQRERFMQRHPHRKTLRQRES